MTRDDIIRLVRQVGMTNGGFLISGTVYELQEFATLVAAAERNKLADEGWRQCAEGQRATQYCGLLEEAVRAERKRLCDRCR